MRSSSRQRERRSRPPVWLVEGLDIVRRRRGTLLAIVIGLIAAAVASAALLPSVVPPRWTVGAAVGLAAVLLGFAVVVALDAMDPIVRGPRHVAAARQELVAVLPTEPDPSEATRLAASVREAWSGGRLRLGIAAADRRVTSVSGWTDALAVALARDGLGVLHIDLAAGWSPPPGLHEVVVDGVAMTEAVSFAPGLSLARLGAGGNQVAAVGSLGAITDRLPRDLDVLLVALPAAASQRVVEAARSLDHVLILGERDRTARIDLIAGADALGTVGHHAQVLLLDDVSAGPAPAPRTESEAAESAAGHADESEREPEAADDADAPAPAPTPPTAAPPAPSEPEPHPEPEPEPERVSEPEPGPEPQPEPERASEPDLDSGSDARDVEVIEHAQTALAATLVDGDTGAQQPPTHVALPDGAPPAEPQPDEHPLVEPQPDEHPPAPPAAFGGEPSPHDAWQGQQTELPAEPEWDEAQTRGDEPLQQDAEPEPNEDVDRTDELAPVTPAPATAADATPTPDPTPQDQSAAADPDADRDPDPSAVEGADDDLLRTTATLAVLDREIDLREGATTAAAADEAPDAEDEPAADPAHDDEDRG